MSNTRFKRVRDWCAPVRIPTIGIYQSPSINQIYQICQPTRDDVRSVFKEMPSNSVFVDIEKVLRFYILSIF